MPATFSPPVNPSVGGLTKSTQPRVLIADFGDGYTQRAGDGLNATERRLSVRWENISAADADMIEAFFEARRGYEAFLWNPPQGGPTGKKWTCPEWERENVDTGIDSITATFRQVFDI